MEQAKATVNDFLHKSGHHDTTVHERVAPAVTNETVHKHQHEETTTAVDREIHQDHYHTTVQPVTDREVLPEEHKHRVIPVEHREHHHGKGEEVKRSLDQEKMHFHDKTTEGKTKETHSTVPIVAGEHVHHHVHETVQPVVQKETIQPSVIHTTVPVHEVHHKDPKHHAASALPAVSLADFKKQGGALGGREERYDAFEGEPKSTITSAMSGAHLHDQSGSSSNQATTGPHDSKLANKADPRVDSDRDGSRNAGLAETSGTATAGSHGASAPHDTHAANRVDPRVHGDHERDAGLQKPGHGSGGIAPTSGNQSALSDNHAPVNTTSTTPHTHSEPLSNTSSVDAPAKKPSLLAKLNPRKDADGDGKKGFLS